MRKGGGEWSQCKNFFLRPDELEIDEVPPSPEPQTSRSGGRLGKREAVTGRRKISPQEPLQREVAPATPQDSPLSFSNPPLLLNPILSQLSPTVVSSASLDLISSAASSLNLEPLPLPENPANAVLDPDTLEFHSPEAEATEMLRSRVTTLGTPPKFQLPERSHFSITTVSASPDAPQAAPFAIEEVVEADEEESYVPHISAVPESSDEDETPPGPPSPVLHPTSFILPPSMPAQTPAPAPTTALDKPVCKEEAMEDAAASAPNSPPKRRFRRAKKGGFVEHCQAMMEMEKAEAGLMGLKTRHLLSRVCREEEELEVVEEMGRLYGLRFLRARASRVDGKSEEVRLVLRGSAPAELEMELGSRLGVSRKSLVVLEEAGRPPIHLPGHTRLLRPEPDPPTPLLPNQPSRGTQWLDLSSNYCLQC